VWGNLEPRVCRNAAYCPGPDGEGQAIGQAREHTANLT
jgi:hypothetical protein